MIARAPRPRRMRLALALAFGLGLAISAPAARADDACAAEVADRVQRRYEKVRDLRARFEQQTERAALGGAKTDALLARGEVVFAKPGKMRWTYESPEPSLVVSDGQTLWIFDEKAREVQKLSLGEGFLSAAGLQFLLGEGKLAEEFRITAQGCDGAAATLLLAPKRDAQYERLDLTVDRASGAVRETGVVDLFGNRTRVAFEDVRENAGVDGDLFRFAVPKGVRVIEVPAAR
jgi:outer membrane lipoprotein carrier protein